MCPPRTSLRSWNISPAAKGNFKTLNDLKKVPGIDLAKPDAGKHLLEFQ
jgi:hypothetical protein